MTEWQNGRSFETDTPAALERAFSDDAPAEWERLNAPDPYDAVLKTAAKDITPAIESLRRAIGELIASTAYLWNTPMVDTVDSYVDSLGNVEGELTAMQKRWERGERE